MACGLPSLNGAARPRQCHPRAYRVGAIPTSISRTFPPRGGVTAIAIPPLRLLEHVTKLCGPAPVIRATTRQGPPMPPSEHPFSTAIRTCSSLRVGISPGDIRVPAPIEPGAAPEMTQEVVERVEALLPMLRERAQEAEDLRRIPDESIKALQEAGFFRLLQPRQWGGHAAD